MDSFTPKERAVNFSSSEKARFQSLIEKYKNILFCKKTDNTTNIRKNRAWAALHTEFNDGGEQPRTLRQLKAKFDNMKRKARKEASQRRQARIRPGGGSPTSSEQHQQDSEFICVMPESIDGLPSDTDEDFPEVNGSASEKNVEYNIEFDPKKPLRICKWAHMGRQNYLELRSESLKESREQAEDIHLLKIKHMEERRKEEREIFELQKKKLKLEISLLENKFETKFEH